MSKHQIEVEGLPEGWEPVAYRVADRFTNEKVFYKGQIHPASSVSYDKEYLIVKKKQPRRITFEETDYNNVRDLEEGVKWTFFDDKYWREVKETEELKLCFSFKECEHILRIAVLPKSVEEKIKLFLRNNNKTS